MLNKGNRQIGGKTYIPVAAYKSKEKAQNRVNKIMPGARIVRGRKPVKHWTVYVPKIK